MSTVAGMVGKALVSEVLTYAFAALDTGIERKAMIDEARALEEQGMTPEQVMATLNDKRKAAHQDLGDALK